MENQVRVYQKSSKPFRPCGELEMQLTNLVPTQPLSLFQQDVGNLAAKIVEEVLNPPDPDPGSLSNIVPDPDAHLDELGKMLDQLEKPIPDNQVLLSEICLVVRQVLLQIKRQCLLMDQRIF